MSVPIGVYRTSLPDIAAVEAYEQFLGLSGSTVDYVLAFMADTPASWAQFENAILAQHTNGGPSTTSATAWAPLLGPRQLVLGVPACCMGTTWAQEAAGVNDTHWAALARTLAATRLGNCVLRIGRELNTGYRWKATPSNVSAYRTGYARIVNTMRSAGFSGTFMWNPMVMPGNFGGSGGGTESAYPGDSVVDVIGLDIYDASWSGIYPTSPDLVTAPMHQAVWDGFLIGWDGLRGWYNFARARGKQLAFPEWGLQLWKDAGVYHGGGDNPVLVGELAQFMKGCGAYMHAMWEDAGMGVSDPDNHPGRPCGVPQARAVFLREFGY